jgi:hypothetical protein
MTPSREAPQPAGSRPPPSADLAGPVELELAKAIEQLPGRNGLPGGSRYELKYDGADLAGRPVGGDVCSAHLFQQRKFSSAKGSAM